MSGFCCQFQLVTGHALAARLWKAWPHVVCSATTSPKLAFGLHHGASKKAVNKVTTAIGETDPLTWALPRTCSSRQSDLALTFIPVELGTLLALCLWKTTALRHLHRDKAYFFSLILISGPLQTIKGMSHSREPN